jgi:hypothetical protein
VLLFSVFASIRGTSDKTIIKMLVGSKTAYVDGVLKTLDAAPNIVAGRTLVPIRFVSEGLGANLAAAGLVTLFSVGFNPSAQAQSKPGTPTPTTQTVSGTVKNVTSKEMKIKKLPSGVFEVTVIATDGAKEIEVKGTSKTMQMAIDKAMQDARIQFTK